MESNPAAAEVAPTHALCAVAVSLLSTAGSLVQGGNRFAQALLLHGASVRVERADVGIGHEMGKLVDQCCRRTRAAVSGLELRPGLNLGHRVVANALGQSDEVAEPGRNQPVNVLFSRHPAMQTVLLCPATSRRPFQ